VTDKLDFDPFELLGVDASADAVTIDRAYKARIRYVHPDIAGPAGLAESKRLNVAREWLLDPKLRERLPKPRPSGRSRWRQRQEQPPAPPDSPWREPQTRTDAPSGAWTTGWESRPPTRPAWDYDPWLDDALAFDYGPATNRLRAFFEDVRALTADERARVTYSLGDEPPVYLGDYLELVSEELKGRSRALSDAVERVWRERDDEGPPLLFPRGRVFGNGAGVAEAYAQWQLLGGAIRQHARDERSVEALASRSTWPWTASLGQPRYGPHERAVEAFLEEARTLPLVIAQRLARAWERDMGSFVYGRPGEDWFPGTLTSPKPELVSARLAAVDASRIEPPIGMDWEQHNGFRCGLRLTAFVLGLGGVDEPGRDYLRPWRTAFDAEPSFVDRARWGLPRG
jgi:hypothetical protein